MSIGEVGGSISSPAELSPGEVAACEDEAAEGERPERASVAGKDRRHQEGQPLAEYLESDEGEAQGRDESEEPGV